MWRLINKITVKQSDKTSIVECLEENNILHYNGNKIANIFNNHFLSVGKKYALSVEKVNTNIKYQGVKNFTRWLVLIAKFSHEVHVRWLFKSHLESI